MELTIDMVRHLAKISRLRLSEEEMELYRGQLEGVFQMFQQLEKIDTEGVEPTYQVHGLVDVMRDDEPEDCECSTKILQQAPGGLVDGQIRTPTTF